jgi:hypothetical protein
MWARLGAFAKSKPGQSLQARPFTFEPIFFAIPDLIVVLFLISPNQKPLFGVIILQIEAIFDPKLYEM